VPCDPGYGTECRVVTPPWADDVINGIGCPVAESGSTIGAADAGGPRRDRGMYGVYVGCRVWVGCRGGGNTPLGRDGTGGGNWLVLGNGDGNAPGDIGGVGGADDVGAIPPETTSG